MNVTVLAIILALSVATKEEDIEIRYERVKRDDSKPVNNISTNDGVEENSKFVDRFNENEIKDVSDSTKMNEIVKEKVKDQLAIPTERKENKNKIGTILTNIKNVVTHEDVEGHRSALSEALLHQLHGPNEKVIFLPNDSDEELTKLDHLSPSIIETGHTHGQQVVLLPKTAEESISANYQLQQIGDKVTLVSTAAEDKAQKLHILPQPIESGLHNPTGKVLVFRKAQEEVLTNLHNIHSPSQKVVLLPKTSEESILHLDEHAGHQKVYYLPKTHEESHGHQKYVILPKGHEESLTAQSLGAHSIGTHSLGAHSLGVHSLGHSLGSHSLGGHSVAIQSLGGHTLGAHHVGAQHLGVHQLGAHHLGAHHVGVHHLGAHHVGVHHLGAHHLGAHHLGAHHLGAQPVGVHHLGAHHIGAHHLGAHHLGAHHLGAHHLGAHHLGSHLGSNYHIHTHGDKIVLLPKITDETVAAINQLNSQSQGVVLLPNAAEEKQSKLHLHPSLLANNELVYKTYGGGYNLPVAPNILSNLNIEQGKVPVVISSMLGLNSPGPQSLVSHLHKNLQHQLSKNILPQLIKHVKLADHQIDKSKHEIDLGAAIHHHFTIVKKVGIPYLKPFPVQIEQRIPYPFLQKVPVLVDRPYKVHVIKPYPVLNPYPKNPEIPVKVPLGYPYKRQVVLNVPKSHILVSRPEHISKSILIQKSEPVLVKHELSKN